ncbi:MAG: hypothetical protein U0V04_19450 [Spirosomataceae bacterium]
MTLVEKCKIGGEFQRIGKIPNNFIDASIPKKEDKSIENTGELNIKYLVGISKESATKINDTLGITTIEELAYWSPAQVAKHLVSVSLGTTNSQLEEEIDILRPKMGEFPTQQTYYETLVMLKMLDSNENQDIIDVTEGNALDFEKTLKDDFQSFSRPAIGTVLTFSQSWNVKGITLGQMLHSVGLAPGEITKIAVIDWQSKISGKQSDNSNETENLDNETAHSLSIQEVQNSVANELQQGGSSATSSSISRSKSQASANDSVSVNAGSAMLNMFTLGLLGDKPKMQSNGGGTNTQKASTFTTASSDSWSIGSRDIAASMSKSINDKTEQHANSARSRRASVIKEVTQSENEKLTTRVIVNYNHMHALNIQYYEVVQIYKILTSIIKAECCLFIPVKTIDFEFGQNIIQFDKFIARYRQALMRGAITLDIRDLLIDDTSIVSLYPTYVSKETKLFNRTKSPSKDLLVSESPEVETTIQPMAGTIISHSIDRFFLEAILSTNFTRENTTNSSRVNLPDTSFIQNCTAFGFEKYPNIRFIGKNNVEIAKGGFGSNDVYTPNTPILLSEIERIEMSGSISEIASKQTLTIELSTNENSYSVYFDVNPNINSDFSTVINLSSNKSARRNRLKAHLIANTEYYSGVIYESLDTTTISLLLANYKWDTIQLLNLIDPKPYKVIGNYLIFKAPNFSSKTFDSNTESKTLGKLVEIEQKLNEFEHKFNSLLEQGTTTTEAKKELRLLLSESKKTLLETQYNELLNEFGITEWAGRDERIVPMPTGGIFAEAVLGRSNSAEKLDITRFWNWQDSPIPILPPDINPLSQIGKGSDIDLKASPFGQPILNIVNPTTLPTGSDLGGILQAVSSANMFRDMSGLSGTQKLVEQASQATTNAAIDSGALTSSNMRTQAQKTVAMAQIAADLAKSIVSAASGVPSTGGGGGSKSSISEQGSKINHGRDMDERKQNKNLDKSENQNNQTKRDGFAGDEMQNEQNATDDGFGTTPLKLAGSIAKDLTNSPVFVSDKILPESNKQGISIYIVTKGDKSIMRNIDDTGEATGNCHKEVSAAWLEYANLHSKNVYTAKSLTDLKTKLKSIKNVPISKIVFLGHGDTDGVFYLDVSNPANKIGLSKENIISLLLSIKLQNDSIIQLRGCYSNIVRKEISASLNQESKRKSIWSCWNTIDKMY